MQALASKVILSILLMVISAIFGKDIAAVVGVYGDQIQDWIANGLVGLFALIAIIGEAKKRSTIQSLKQEVVEQTFRAEQAEMNTKRARIPPKRE